MSPTPSVASLSNKAAFMESLNLSIIESLALQTRLAHLSQVATGEQLAIPGNLECTVVTPPMSGSFNVVFELKFSDATSWVIRMPIDEWTPARARSMHQDVVAMQYITSHTSVPIPALHAYSCDTDNPLEHPYMIMDFVRGTLLIDVWYDSSWWTGERKKESLIQSLASNMVELASLEFDQIGRLDRVQPDGQHFIAPFPDVGIIFDDGRQPCGELGPFSTTHEYLTALLDARRARTGDDSMCGLLRMFIGALIDPRFDRAPFCLGHPDLEIQNIIVDDTGRVAAFIDWDGVAVGCRQMHALSYPLWLTVDWDPTMYEPQKHNPAECDSEQELQRYRETYVNAVDAASGGKLAHVTRNSHIPTCVEMVITNEIVTAGIVFQLGTYVFGSGTLTLDVLDGIEHSGWHALGSSDSKMAEIIRWDRYESLPADDEGSQTDGTASEEGGGSIEQGKRDEESTAKGLAETVASIADQTDVV